MNLNINDGNSGEFSNIKELDDWIDFLQKNPNEIDNLMFDELEMLTQYLKARNNYIKRMVGNVWWWRTRWGSKNSL